MKAVKQVFATYMVHNSPTTFQTGFITGNGTYVKMIQNYANVHELIIEVYSVEGSTLKVID